MKIRNNWFTTIGGIMAGFGLIPISVGTAGKSMPNWLYLVCIFVGTLGPVVIGVGAKGQDEHSDLQEVKNATIKKEETEAPVEPKP
jgi:hypothetical protein